VLATAGPGSASDFRSGLDALPAGEAVHLVSGPFSIENSLQGRRRGRIRTDPRIFGGSTSRSNIRGPALKPMVELRPPAPDLSLLIPFAYISPISRLYLAYISSISPLYLLYISGI
jgi:hypothetical protein